MLRVGGGIIIQKASKRKVTILSWNIPNKLHVTLLPFVLVMVLINMTGKSNKYCQKWYHRKYTWKKEKLQWKSSRQKVCKEIINPILIWVYLRKRFGGGLIYPSSNLSNSHSPSRSIHGVLFLQIEKFETEKFQNNLLLWLKLLWIADDSPTRTMVSFILWAALLLRKLGFDWRSLHRVIIPAMKTRKK